MIKAKQARHGKRIEEAPTEKRPNKKYGQAHEENIEVCLSCPYKYCRGECDRIRRKGNAG